MITVTIFKDSGQAKRGIEVKGHAGYADAGSDIICAAVSALTLNTLNSLEAFTKDDFLGEVNEESGKLMIFFSSAMSSKSSLLMESLVLGLQNIADAYGDEYIKIRFKEV